MLTNKNEIRESIIDLFEIKKLPEEKQEEMINKIGQIIFQGVLVRVLPAMEEKDQDEFNKMMDSGTEPDKVFEFFLTKVPDFMLIVADEAESFRREAGQVMAKI